MTARQKKLLWDIDQAIDGIESFTSGYDAAKYAAEHLVQSGVEREFEKLGEAARRLRDEAPEVFQQVAGLKGAIAFRNFLIHVYDAIDQRKVWSIIETELPPLRIAIRALRAE